jgi:hypothetical protein
MSGRAPFSELRAGLFIVLSKPFEMPTTVCETLLFGGLVIL